MIERAIVQECGRDGHTSPYERPREVRETVQRLRRWHQGAPEGCANCRSGNAVVVRAGTALCAVCREQAAQRVAPVLSSRGWVPGQEERAERDERGISGTFIVFNSESVDLGGFTEVITPGAVDRSLRHDDIRALWGHDAGIVLGRRSAGTLDVQKRADGLFAAIQPPTWATSQVESVERRDVSNASFGFVVHEDEWAVRGDSLLRTVEDMTIMEVSVVAFPAYPATRVRVDRAAYRQEMDTLARVRMAR